MKTSEFNRRDFLKLSGITAAGLTVAACGGVPATGPAPSAAEAGGGAAVPAPAVVEGLAEVPREKSFVAMFGGDGTQFTDVGLGNPYATGATHQLGGASMQEPLFFYEVFTSEIVPWLATDYAYSEDFSELTINLRDGVKWSDGEPFNAEDVVFTIQMLIDNAPLLTRSPAVKAAVASAEAIDDLTVKFMFNGPRPRFFFDLLVSKFDTGLYWVPEHIFKDVEDVSAFKFYDLEQGWPVATGPYKVVGWTNQQKIYDRRDEWWGVESGFMDSMPEVERIIVTPRASDTLMIQRLVNNELDTTQGLRASTAPEAVDQNPAVITHTGRELPYGYMDWWPTAIWFNHEEGPFTSKEMRWAVSYSINREQVLDVALGSSGLLTELPFPKYPEMIPYFEATQALLEKYPTTEYNPDKAAALLEGMGYAKDGEGFWVKDGERIPASISGTENMNDIGPIIAEQLRQGGFEAEFVTPADHGTRISDGTQKIWLNGHAGSINDPFPTLDYFTSKYWAPIGEPTAFSSRFNNPEYDAILEEMATTPSDAPNYMDLYLAAIEIYLDELIDAPFQQWMHRIPYNTTYWTGWPTADNPGPNGAFWALTFGEWIHDLKAVQ